MPTPPASARELGRTSEPPPGPEVTPTSFQIEHPGPVHDIFFSVAQRGYMPLKVEIVSTVSWMSVTDINDQGQRKGVTVRIDLEHLPIEEMQAGCIEVRWSQGCTRVEVSATRYDVRRAIERYTAGRMDQAKELCRRIIESVPQQRSAAYLLTSLYLDDHNFPAAVRLLQDLSSSAGKAPLDPALQHVPGEAIGDMVSVLSEHFSILKPLEYGIHVLTELLEGNNEQAARIRPLLRRAYLQYLQDLTEERRSRPRQGESAEARRTYITLRSPQQASLQDVLPSQQRLDGLPREGVLRLIGYAQRAAQAFPNERTWPSVLRSLEDNLKERNTRALLSTARVAALVACVLLLCYGAYTTLQQRSLTQAEAALRRGDHEAALLAAQQVLPGLQRGRRARILCGESLLGWASEARRGGEFAVAWGRLDGAAQHLGPDERLPRARATLLEAWSTDLIHRGRFDLAFERLEQAIQHDPQNSRLQIRRQSITAVAKLYKRLRALTSSGSTSPTPQGATSAPASAPGDSSLGMDLVSPQTQVLITDWDGEGPDEVMISGHAPGGPPDSTRIAVHRPRIREMAGGAVQVAVETVFTRATGHRSRPANLQAFAAEPLGLHLKGVDGKKLKSRALSPTSSSVADGNAHGLRVLQADLAGAAEESGTTWLIWKESGQLRTWSPPHSVALARVRSVSASAPPAIWTWEQLETAGDRHRVWLPLPYRWQEGVLKPCPELYADYYLDEVIPDLKKLETSLVSSHPAEQARMRAQVARAVQRATAFSRL